MVVLARRELENSTAGEYVDVLVAVDSAASKHDWRGQSQTGRERVDVRAAGARVLHLVHYIHY